MTTIFSRIFHDRGNPDTETESTSMTMYMYSTWIIDTAGKLTHVSYGNLHQRKKPKNEDFKGIIVALDATIWVMTSFFQIFLGGGGGIPPPPPPPQAGMAPQAPYSSTATLASCHKI